MALASIVLACPAVDSPAAFLLQVSGPDRTHWISLPAGEFVLSWVHSVERTPWRDSYEVDPDGRIILTASEFESGGAGLPDTVGPGESFRIRGGKMAITGRHVVLDEIRILLSDISHHYLHLDGRIVDLNAVFGEGVVSIRVMKKERGGGE